MVSPHGSTIPRLIIRCTQVVLQAIVPLSSVSCLVQFLGQMGCASDFFFSLLLDLLGGLLHSPPCRLLCHPQSLTLVMTGRLDLLWLPRQPGCDRLYPQRDPDLSSPAHYTCV
jgi:hypothetical protein